MSGGHAVSDLRVVFGRLAIAEKHDTAERYRAPHRVERIWFGWAGIQADMAAGESPVCMPAEIVDSFAIPILVSENSLLF
jgi:hypothetical protein